jgi:NAD(P)-dependent dehydrogenase (short-subunit alcohol dehydrogenase family)
MARAPRSLAGKVVAITGGARGIGRATAAALIAQGARVAIGDLDAPLAAKTAQELGSGTLGLPLDVTDRASFENFLGEVERQVGPLDVLINNAGIMPIGPFVTETDSTAKRMVDINLHGVIYGSKLALERFLPRGQGHLVNVASIAGKGGAAGGVTYCATKHAVVGLSEAIRAEVRGTDIDVTIVMPVGVNTELYSGVQPIRGFKVAEPEDVANAIVEALQSGRVDVFVPKSIQGLFRFMNLVPRAVADAFAKVMKADQVLLHSDPRARGAYLSRTGDPTAAGPMPAADLAAPTPAAGPAAPTPAAGPAARTPAADPAAPTPAADPAAPTPAAATATSAPAPESQPVAGNGAGSADPADSEKQTA